MNDNAAITALFYEKLDNKATKCGLCPHYCIIADGKTGLCGVRSNIDGELRACSYGLVTSVALDPIEKKPLYHFHPGKKIVSLGSYGCNLKCQFCQNYNISMEYHNIKPEVMTPALAAEVAVLAVNDGNVGIAYTYNEPLIGYEFVKDCSLLIKKEGLLNVLVTNGYINNEPLKELLPSIDAMNIDIKGYNNRTYNRLSGTLEPVENTIITASKSCHVEVTTLVIPGENENEVEDIAKWLSTINPQIPYHLSRFFPRYKYSEGNPTPPELMHSLKEKAEKYLQYVHLGNM
ncbi:MAG: AmmeMemoRadiSam system radical SAM enzyme [Oscillospiraceae bacterium]|nr:AmmeMemoRadiSam system radical SAM enzyme [Oscillospiraceae bacterium]